MPACGPTAVGARGLDDQGDLRRPEQCRMVGSRSTASALLEGRQSRTSSPFVATKHADRVLQSNSLPRGQHVQKGEGLILSRYRAAKGSSSPPTTLALEFLHRGDVVIHPLQEGVHPRYRRALDGVLRYPADVARPCPEAFDRIERWGVAQHRRVLARGQLRLRLGCLETGAVARSPRRWQPLDEGVRWAPLGPVLAVAGPRGLWARRRGVRAGSRSLLLSAIHHVGRSAAWRDVIHRRPPGMRREAVSSRRLLGTRRAPHRSDRIALWGMAWGTGRIKTPADSPSGVISWPVRGEPARIRTENLVIKSHLLCR